MIGRITKPTMDRPETYDIKVPGELDPGWSEWSGPLRITVDRECGGFPVTTLSGAMDQAALHGLLRRLYALGLPLISVNLLGKVTDPVIATEEWTAEK